MEYDEEVIEPFIRYKQDEISPEEEIKRKIRKGFIYKVFGIVAYQIILVFIMVNLAFSIKYLHNWILSSRKMLYFTFIVFMTCLILPIFKPSLYRTVPLNYIILTIFTISYGWWIAAFTLMFTKTSVLFVLFLTIVTVTSLTVYAFITKSDFTGLGGFLSTALIVLIFASILELIFPMPLLNLIISYFSLMIFSLYLIYDVQLVAGDKQKKFSEDDYILAALNIYLDIIGIFIQLLQFFGTRNSN